MHLVFKVRISRISYVLLYPRRLCFQTDVHDITYSDHVRSLKDALRD